MLPDRAEARPLGVFALEQRRGVDARPKTLARELHRELVAERVQTLLDDGVVVVAARVTGDASARGRRGVRFRIRAAVVVAIRDADDRARAFHQPRGIEEHGLVPREIAHLAETAVGEPCGSTPASLAGHALHPLELRVLENQRLRSD